MESKQVSPAWGFNIDKVERYAYNKTAFTPEECAMIIAIGKSNDLMDATITSDIKPIDKEYRDSKIVFLYPNDETAWLYKKLTDHVTYLNSQYFGFDLWGFTEGLQFTEYNAPSGKYDSHIDKCTMELFENYQL